MFIISVFSANYGAFACALWRRLWCTLIKPKESTVFHIDFRLAKTNWNRYFCGGISSFFRMHRMQSSSTAAADAHTTQLAHTRATAWRPAALLPPLWRLALFLVDRYLGFIIAQGGGDIPRHPCSWGRNNICNFRRGFYEFKPDFLTRDCYRYFNYNHDCSFLFIYIFTSFHRKTNIP